MQVTRFRDRRLRPLLELPPRRAPPLRHVPPRRPPLGPRGPAPPAPRPRVPRGRRPQAAAARRGARRHRRHRAEPREDRPARPRLPDAPPPRLRPDAPAPRRRHGSRGLAPPEEARLDIRGSTTIARTPSWAGASRSRRWPTSWAAPAIHVSGQGVREGMAYSLMSREMPEARQRARRLGPRAGEGLQRMGRRPRRDGGPRWPTPSCGALDRRAGEEIREALGHAATILDVGRSIDYFERHDHVADIVLATDLVGFLPSRDRPPLGDRPQRRGRRIRPEALRPAPRRRRPGRHRAGRRRSWRWPTTSASGAPRDDASRSAARRTRSQAPSSRWWGSWAGVRGGSGRDSSGCSVDPCASSREHADHALCPRRPHDEPAPPRRRRRRRRPRSAAAAAPSRRAKRPGAQNPVPDVAAMSEALEAVVERVKPGVVQILATGYAAGTKGSEPLLVKQRATGSGVILDPGGLHPDQRSRRRRRATARGACCPASPPARVPPGRSCGPTAASRAPASSASTTRPTSRSSRWTRRGCPRSPWPTPRRSDQGQLVLAVGSPLGLENSVEPGDRERGRPAARAREPDDLRPDRREHQPRQQRRAARRRRGTRGRDQHADPLAGRRQRGDRLRGPEQHRQERLRSDPQDGAREPRRDRPPGPDRDPGAGPGSRSSPRLGRHRRRRDAEGPARPRPASRSATS